MLSKKFRGLTPVEVSEIFAGPNQTVSNRFFRILWMRGSESTSRFAIVTTPKLHRSAVVRNRLRRVLSEMIRLNFSRWTVGFRIAIVVKTSALRATRQELRDSFLEMMKRIGFITL